MKPLTAQARQQAAAWAVSLAEGALPADRRRALDAWLAADPQHPAALRQARLLWTTLGSCRQRSGRRYNRRWRR